MKPVAIVQHEDDVTAGEFERFLVDRDLPFVTLRASNGLPRSAAPYAGICSLGGAMSANDALPWIDDELALLRDADRRGLPVIGHCLGGQLMSRAYGGSVRASEHKEIGWGVVTVTDPVLASEWLDTDPGSFEVFQWHGDVFDLPPTARNWLASDFAEQQAFVLERQGVAHLGMQFHIEMTPELVRAWSTDPAGVREIEDERRRSGGPAVQQPQEMLNELESRCARMRAVARRLYERWIRGLARD